MAAHQHMQGQKLKILDHIVKVLQVCVSAMLPEVLPREWSQQLLSLQTIVLIAACNSTRACLNKRSCDVLQVHLRLVVPSLAFLCLISLC